MSRRTPGVAAGWPWARGISLSLAQPTWYAYGIVVSLSAPSGCLYPHADARYGDPLEKVGDGDGAIWVARGTGLKLGRAEGVPERSGRFPYGDVDECAAAGYSTVELSGDEAWVLFHEGRVVSPGIQESVRGLGCHVEMVDQDHCAVPLVSQLLRIACL